MSPSDVVVPVSVLPGACLRTDVDWCDVFLDLRSDQSVELPKRMPAVHRSVTLGAGVARGWRTQGGERPYPNTDLYLVWTDASGFTGGVALTQPVTLVGGFADRTGVVSGLTHVFQETRVQTAEWDLVHASQHERVMTRFLPVMSRVLRDRTVLDPVDGVESGVEAALFRLRWAVVGVSDVSRIPEGLGAVASWKSMGLSQEDPAAEGFASAGAAAAAEWARAGLFDLGEVAAWSHSMFGSLALVALRANRVDTFSKWRGLGFTAEETRAWWDVCVLPLSDDTNWKKRRMTGEEVRRVADLGLTPAVLGFLLGRMPDGTSRVEVNAALGAWARVPGEKIAFYVSAGISPEEAKRMESSGDAPDVAALTMLAGFNGDASILG